MNKINFEIVTPEKVAFEDAIDSLTVDTKDGEITVLPNHMPLVSVLRAGEMTIRKGKEEITMAVAGGFVEIQSGSTVIIVADEAERAEEVDVVSAEEARKRAEEILAQKTETEDVADVRAALAHALARLKVARKKRRQV